MRTRTKLMLTAGVLGVIGLLVVLATGAFFSATTESQANIASTGTMSVDCTNATTAAVDEFNDTTACGDMFASAGPNTMKPVATGLPNLQDNLAAARLPSATVSGTLDIVVNPTLRVDRLVLSQNTVGGTDPDGPGPLTNTDLAGLLNICIGDDAIDAPDASDPDGVGDANPLGDCDVYMGPFNMGATNTVAYDVANPLTPTPIPAAPAAGNTRTFEFEVWFPDDGTDHNAYQGEDASANFMLTAT